MASQRICIFCGRSPEDKNNEHPLPRWLLEMTGDPNRVVRHGVHWETRKPFEFAFDAFQFPACRKCNDEYSKLETSAKVIVEEIAQRKAVSPSNYVLLLDWLDKVRIGLWLGHNYLQGAPLSPTFTINSRVGTKDRMVAIYAFLDQRDGLNTWGPESPLFHFKPSVFSMRVNKVVFLNASWDWMCSSRCGYPFPQEIVYSNEVEGMWLASGYRCRRRVTHPITPKLFKPCVALFQPVLAEDPDTKESALDDSMVEYVRLNAWPGRARLGPLFRQTASSTERIFANDSDIEFDSVSIPEARRLVDVATQAYTLLVDSLEREPSSYENGTRFDRSHLVNLARHNTRVTKQLRQMPNEKYKQLRGEFDARLKQRIATRSRRAPTSEQ